MLTSERSTSISLVLSMMLMIVTLSSLRAIAQETSLLFVFAPMLSIYNFIEIFRVVYKEGADNKESSQ